MEKFLSFLLSFMCCLVLVHAQESPPLLEATEENLATLEEHAVLTETWIQARVQDSAQFYGDQLYEMLTLSPPPGKEGLWIQSIITLSFRYLQRDPAQNDSLLDVGLGLATTQRDSFDLYLTKYQNRFWNSIEVSRRDELDQAKKLMQKDFGISILDYYLSSSAFYVENDNLLLALEDLETAKRSVQLDVFGQITVDHNLGIIYTELGAYDEAIGIYNNMLRIADSLQEPTLRYSSESLLGDVNERREENQIALTHLGNALQIAELHQLVHNLADVHQLIGWLLVEEGAVDSAQTHFLEGIRITESRPEEPSWSNCHLGLSLIEFEKGNFSTGIALGEKGLPNSNSHYKEEYVPKMAEAYSKIGKEDSAYAKMSLLWKEERDKHQQEESYQMVSTLLQNQYELDREKERRASDLALYRQRSWGVGIIGGLILLGLGLALAWKTRTTSKLKTLNEALSHRNQNLQHFSYIASHDLKEPLRNISTFAGLMQMKLNRGESGEELKSYLEFIIKGATTLQGMIKSLHTYTRVSFGQQKLEAVSISQTFGEVREHLLPLIESKAGKLTFTQEAGTDQLIFEKNLLFLILKNLIQNGFSYNRSPIPTVEVTTKNHQGGTLISVTDNGIGIDPAYQEVVFQPFKSLENKTATQSSGLGLAICQNILDNYGGRMELTSALGEGSTFRVWIPKLKLAAEE